jgi:hypothetical protein
MCYASGAANRLVDPGFYRMSTTASIVMFFQTIISKKHRWKRKMDGTLTVMMFLAMMGIEVKGMRVGFFSIIGFHPSKEVIFFSQSEKRGLAYHWNTFKVQDLGDMYPTGYDYFAEMYPSIHVAFPYTPCWM